MILNLRHIIRRFYAVGSEWPIKSICLLGCQLNEISVAPTHNIVQFWFSVYFFRRCKAFLYDGAGYCNLHHLSMQFRVLIPLDLSDIPVAVEILSKNQINKITTF